ncbi:AarF/UbiB family protein [Mesobacillus maritimus]
MEGFFYADPHPGNLRYDCETEQLALIDFGPGGYINGNYEI